MSSRLTRALLALYPRRIRDRYGDELLDLDDELRAHGEISRARAIRDMLAGALFVASARRRGGAIAATLVVGGIAAGAAILGGSGSGLRSRPRMHAAATTTTARAVPPTSARPGPCFVADGGSCASTACRVFTVYRPVPLAPVTPTDRRRPRTARCVGGRVTSPRPVYVGG